MDGVAAPSLLPGRINPCEAIEPALDRAEQLAMVDLNVRALTDLTLACLPSIRAARGGILNVASTAAFQPGPGMAVYYATKAYVLSFSEALWEEHAHGKDGYDYTMYQKSPAAAGAPPEAF